VNNNVEFIGQAAEDPDNVLRQAVGELESVVVIGYDKDGEVSIAASTNIDRANINWLLDYAKRACLDLEKEE